MNELYTELGYLIANHYALCKRAITLKLHEADQEQMNSYKACLFNDDPWNVEILTYTDDIGGKDPGPPGRKAPESGKTK